MIDAWAGMLWQRFKDIYGQKWLSMFQGDDAIESWRVTWASGLDVSAEQIRHALSRIGSEYPDWPPTFGQFKALCGDMPKPYISLPPPPKIKPTAERMKALLEAAMTPRKGQWWTPERVVNKQQVNFIVLQAARFGAESAQGRFLDKCKEYGCISSDNQFQRPKRVEAA